MVLLFLCLIDCLASAFACVVPMKERNSNSDIEYNLHFIDILFVVVASFVLKMKLKFLSYPQFFRLIDTPVPGAKSKHAAKHVTQLDKVQMRRV